MNKRFEFKDVDEEYVNNYEALERKYRIYSTAAQRLVEWAGVKRSDKVVDLGCGTGISSIEIYKRIEEKGKLIGIDISPRMLQSAKRKFRGKRNVRFIVGNAFDLSELINEKVDVVISSFTFYYFLGNLEKVFQEVYKVLKPGGRYAFNITSYLTPITFEEKEYNTFGYILWEVADEVLKKHGYEGRGEYAFDLSLLNNCERVKEMLRNVGYSSVECRVTQLPLTPEATLDFTYEGFWKYGAGTSFSTTLRNLSLEERIKLIEEIVEKTKRRLKSEGVRDIPSILEILAIK